MSAPIKSIHYQVTNGQALLMLMAALRFIYQGKGTRDYSKAAVLEFIKQSGWFDLQPEDYHPYPSVDGDEPRWQTLLAWARLNGVQAGLITPQVRNEWMPTTDGLNVWPVAKQCFQQGMWDVRKCYLWTPVLKRLFDPRCEESWECDMRPRAIYEDQISFPFKSVHAVNAPPKYTLADLL